MIKILTQKSKIIFLIKIFKKRWSVLIINGYSPFEFARLGPVPKNMLAIRGLL